MYTRCQISDLQETCSASPTAREWAHKPRVDPGLKPLSVLSMSRSSLFLSRFPLSCPNPATNGSPRSAVIGPSMSGPANRAMHLRSWALNRPVEPPLRLARDIAVTNARPNHEARSPSQAQAPAPCRSFPHLPASANEAIRLSVVAGRAPFAEPRGAGSLSQAL